MHAIDFAPDPAGTRSTAACTVQMGKGATATAKTMGSAWRHHLMEHVPPGRARSFRAAPAHRQNITSPALLNACTQGHVVSKAASAVPASPGRNVLCAHGRVLTASFHQRPGAATVMSRKMDPAATTLCLMPTGTVVMVERSVNDMARAATLEVSDSSQIWNPGSKDPRFASHDSSDP